MNKWLCSIMGGALAALSCMGPPAAQAQTSVAAGAGSYASSISPGAPGDDGYYGPSVTNMLNYYNSSLYIAPSLKSRAIPTNQWWTDLLFSTRNQGGGTWIQQPLTSSLWVFPQIVAPTAAGMWIFAPAGYESRPITAPVSYANAGPYLQVDGITNGHTFSATNPVVTAYGDWTVTYSENDTTSNGSISTTLARGVPYVWVQYTNTNPEIAMNGAPTDAAGNPISLTSGSFTATSLSMTSGGKTFGIFAPPNTTFTVSGNYIIPQLGASGYVVYGMLPNSGSLTEFAQYAYARPTGSQMTYTYNRAAGQIQTTWNLTTSPLSGTNTQTLQGWLPHHYHATTNNLSFKSYSYMTPRGTMMMTSGSTWNITWPFRGIAPVLPAPSDTSAATNPYLLSRMQNYISSYVSGGNHPVFVADTYNEGKELGLAAQALTMADQLGMTSQKSTLLSNTESLLSNWFTYTPGKSSEYFGRLGSYGALVGVPMSFGTGAFNDNHYHYGYFTIAAALAGMADPAWIANYGPMATQVAKEFGNWDRNDTSFPYMRVLDIWEGHSWASGYSAQFGQNQESSSEAMNAWVGLFMLGNATSNSAMTDAGAMAYAMESSAVNEYWQDWKHTNFPQGYGLFGVGIVAAGQIQYQNNFTNEPFWNYAIQWLPVNHWNNYLSRDTNYAQANLNAIFPERALMAQYAVAGYGLPDANNSWAVFTNMPGDYALGFQELFDPLSVCGEFDSYFNAGQSIATVTNPPAANSGFPGSVYYIAHAQRALGIQDLNFYTSIPTSQVYYNASTGVRTAVIYNPLSTLQTATVYYNGTSVTTVTVPAGKLVSQVITGGTTLSIPNAPTGITATAGTGQITVTWGAVSGATSYAVYRNSSSASQSHWFTGLTTTSFTDTGLVADGHGYIYTVYAVNAAGLSPASTPTASIRLYGAGVQTTTDYLYDLTMPTSQSIGWSTDGGNMGSFNNDGGRASRAYQRDDTEYLVYSFPNLTNFAATVWSLNGPITAVTFYTSTNNGVSFQPLTVNYGTKTANSSGWGYYTITPAGSLPANTTDLKVQVAAGSGNNWDPQIGQISFTYGGTVNTAPPAPTGLTATAGNAQVALAWNASSGATSYNIYRGTTAGGESATAIATGVTTTSFTDTGLTNGTQYFYKVAAVNSVGTSGQSNEASATPIAPTSTTITDPLTDWSVINSKSANWALDGSNTTYFNGDTSRATRTVDDTEYLIYKFTGITTFSAKVYIYQGPASTAKFYTSVDNGSTYQLTSVTTGTETASAAGWGYYTITPAGSLPANVTNLKVEFNAGTGNAWDPQLSQISITYGGATGTAPAAPTGLTATGGNAQVALSWAASSGATSYNIYRGTTAGGESTTAVATGITGTSYTNTGLTNGTAYFYKVAAVNASGTSGLSNEASATPAATVTIPSAPTSLTATAGNAQVSLSWTASSGATSYNVYRGTTAGGESATAIATGITTTSFTNTGLTNGIQYFYKVAAVNSAGTSGLSNEASATPAGSSPGSLVDDLNDWTKVTTKTANWGFDTTTATNFNGDTSRAVRTVDDAENITYAVPNTTGFSIVVYTKAATISQVNILASTNNGSTYAATAVTVGTRTLTANGWGYYTLTNPATLSGVTNLQIQLLPGSGSAADPELGKVTITHN